MSAFRRQPIRGTSFSFVDRFHRPAGGQLGQAQPSRVTGTGAQHLKHSPPNSTSCSPSWIPRPARDRCRRPPYRRSRRDPWGGCQEPAVRHPSLQNWEAGARWRYPHSDTGTLHSWIFTVGVAPSTRGAVGGCCMVLTTVAPAIQVRRPAPAASQAGANTPLHSSLPRQLFSSLSPHSHPTVPMHRL
jgi:hypothetical protein